MIFLHKNKFYDLPLEPSHRDGSNEGSQCMFWLRNKKIIFELSSIPLLSGSAYTKQFAAIGVNYFL